MVYRFRENYSAPVGAQVVGDRLEVIRGSHGDITPAAVVDDSRPGAAPLHPCFEWDDRIAAESYREDQARRLIRSIEVVPDPEPGSDEPEPPRLAYVSVARPNGGGQAYIPTVEALSDDELRARVMGDCLRQLRGLQARYRQFREITEAIQAAVDELEGAGIASR